MLDLITAWAACSAKVLCALSHSWAACTVFGMLSMLALHCIIQGVVGTSSGAIHYINWSESSRVSIVSGHSSGITSAAFTRDSSLLATTSTDGSLSVWRADTLEQTVLFQAQKSPCNCVAFAPSSLRQLTDEQEQGGASSSVVAGYGDGTLRVFDLEAVKMKRKMKPHSEAAQVIAFSIDGKNHPVK